MQWLTGFKCFDHRLSHRCGRARVLTGDEVAFANDKGMPILPLDVNPAFCFNHILQGERDHIFTCTRGFLAIGITCYFFALDQ